MSGMKIFILVCLALNFALLKDVSLGQKCTDEKCGCFDQKKKENKVEILKGLHCYLENNALKGVLWMRVKRICTNPDGCFCRKVSHTTDKPLPEKVCKQNSMCSAGKDQFVCVEAPVAQGAKCSDAQGCVCKVNGATALTKFNTAFCAKDRECTTARGRAACFQSAVALNKECSGLSCLCKPADNDTNPDQWSICRKRDKCEVRLKTAGAVCTPTVQRKKKKSKKKVTANTEVNNNQNQQPEQKGNEAEEDDAEEGEGEEEDENVQEEDEEDDQEEQGEQKEIISGGNQRLSLSRI